MTGSGVVLLAGSHLPTATDTMPLRFPTLDELRRRRAAINATVGRKLIPRIVAASVAQLVMVGALFANREALHQWNALMPALFVVIALSSVVGVWLVMFWRPRLSATLAAEDGLLCHRCGAPLLLPVTRERASLMLTRGGLAPQHYLHEGYCRTCNAPVVAELQEGAVLGAHAR